MSDCTQCADYKWCAENEECAMFKQKTMTNANRIRAMSDEELAEWVWGAETAGRAYGPRGKKAWLDWLREEAKDD